ncbi:MAG TPA: hypothetical protein VNN74_00365 [Candidatus Micrarchaeia archaeon]|nr:hypothetical protein [Candidatus Micrarchaeia archaeon]
MAAVPAGPTESASTNRRPRGPVDRIGAVRWDLPADVAHHQRLPTHPCATIILGHPDLRPDARALAPLEAS